NNYIHGNHGNAAYLGWDVSVGRFHDNIIVNNEGFSPVIGSTAPNYSHYYNNTIANNSSEGFLHGNGSGIWTCGQQKIYNNIFHGNTGIYFERMDPTHGDPTAFNNCHAFPNGVTGEDDVYANPQFTQPTEGLGPTFDHSTMPSHWTLLETSPCRDAGATNMSQYYPETDFFGNPRVVYGHIDIGAVEFPDLDAMEELSAQSSVFPNPGRNILHVETEMENAIIAVYNLSGRKIVEQKIDGGSANIVTENWPSEMYFWSIISTDSKSLVETGKWVKE
ncbi:MAG: T9SS type A sorting domain-containing protein, partial [bacterium]|nr:T9SS type A sorting domain-containing protein [Candidatus Limimorpha equi]